MNWKSIIFVLVLFISCKNEEVKIPKDVFSEEKMINLLVEIHLADAMAANERIKEVNLLNEVKKAYFSSLLEKENISLADFENSLAFYQKNADLFFGVYEKVMVKLTEKEADLNGEKTKETKKD